MSRRGEDLARFRDQLATDEPMPPRLFWFAVGIGVGTALDLIARSEIVRPLWQDVALGVVVCAGLGLISAMIAWFLWLFIEPLWDLVRGWFGRRRDGGSAD
jgi:hypothetical protein